MNHQESHILIVDDESSILDMLATYFTSLSYPNHKASNAEKAIEVLNSDKAVDLLITDIDLPGMSGLDLLKIARETRPEVPVIIITGLKTLETAIQAIRHGAQDYITKPFELGDVRKVVEKALRYRRSSLKKERIFEFAKSMNINFDIPTELVDAGVVADYLARFLLNSGFCTKEDYHQFYVAFMETLINAIEHGNLELPSSIKGKGDDFLRITQFEEEREKRLHNSPYKDRILRVAFLFNQKRFSLTITDQGPGFDWKSYVNDGNALNQINTKPYGRGFMLIQHIIDEVYFNESGNSITLVKSGTKANT